MCMSCGGHFDPGAHCKEDCHGAAPVIDWRARAENAEKELARLKRNGDQLLAVLVKVAVDKVSARAERAEAERDEARDWVRRLTAEHRTLTCIYCGHAYPSGSPTHGAEVLTEHIKVCPKHPMAAALTRAEAAEKRAAELEAWVRDCGRHDEGCARYTLYRSGILPSGIRCDCGLSALLAPTVTP